MNLIPTLFITAAAFDLSGIIALLFMIGALIGIYVKQIKDISEIKLTMKRDKQETDKEIALLKIQLDAQSRKDDEMLSILSDIKTNIAVYDEKLTNVIKTFIRSE